jgi:S-formylglutathione hydrolase FrmB
MADRRSGRLYEASRHRVGRAPAGLPPDARGRIHTLGGGLPTSARTRARAARVGASGRSGREQPVSKSQPKPERLQEACRRSGVSLDLRLQAGYERSHLFIASFIEEHLRFNARNP